MAISFNSIPISLRVPGSYIEFDNSQANRGLPVMPSRILVFGMRLTTGTVTAGVVTLVSTAQQAAQFFGRGSQLHRMISAIKAANPFTELWAIAQDENVAGVKASGTFTITGPATAAGTVPAYIGGRLVQAGVAVGDTATAVATALAAAINADLDADVTAASAAGVVTVTARHKGLYGNDIDLRVGFAPTDALPAGITIAVAAMSGGTTAPVLTASISALADDWYQTWIVGYNDSTSMTAINAELDRRWGPTVMAEGHAYFGYSGTLGNAATFGLAQNTPHLSTVAVRNSLTPSWMVAAIAGAVAEYYGNIDPARPLQTLPLTGMLPPAPVDRFIYSERNTLLFDGMSTWTVDSGGQPRIERMVTMYRNNAQGLPDASYLDVEAVKTLAFLRYSLRTRITSKFPRYKLANDGTQFGPGQAVVTPSVIKAELIAWFSEAMEIGLVEDIDSFKRDLIVERDAQDVNRVNALIPPNLINQFRIFAGQIRFIA